MNYPSSQFKRYFLFSLFSCFLNWATLSLAATNLADSPISTKVTVPSNVALALSVEFPTAVGRSYPDAYTLSSTYIGYFDSEKCYKYVPNVTTLSGLYNTGVNSAGTSVLSTGSDDPHWAASINPSSNDVNNVVANGDSDSAFIGSSGTTVAGDYYYQTSFNIASDVDPTKVSISFTLWADDSLKTILVNCTSAIASCTGSTNTGITSTATGSSSATVTIAAGQYPFKVGTNTLTLVLNNANTAASSYSASCTALVSCSCPSGGTLSASWPFFSGTCNIAAGPSAVKLRVDNISLTAQSGAGSYFQPVAAATGHACNAVTNGRWSGNFLNWALTQTIDPLRYALSGGYRAVDTTTTTILEKAWASNQGGGNPTALTNSTLISQSTPYSVSNLNLVTYAQGNKFQFYVTSAGSTVVSDNLPNSLSTNVTYELYGRVKVCDASVGVESNCVAYGSNYKPEGLIQKYSMNLNFAAFGYLNDSSITRDGGVMRARMGPVGPLKPVPGSSNVDNTTRKEWDAATGVFYTNPHTADNAGVSNSGVINYLNKFGLYANSYKTYDPVGEMYYTVLRYFRKKGSVSAYSSGYTTSMSEDFPVITDWTNDDPIKYYCQKNYIIGVGDSNTHADSNLPGSTIRGSSEPSLPTEVANDYGSLSNTTTNYTDVTTSTTRVGNIEKIANLATRTIPWCCNDGNTFFMAGLAYDVHTRDFRPDLTNTQTIDTYWLDVLESGDRFNYNSETGMRNQFWLTAKYGGFTRDDSYAPYTGTATSIDSSKWDTNNDGDPDNYYRANNPSLMIQGLNKAFASIADSGNNVSTAFGFTAPTVTNGDISYNSKYYDGKWTGDVIATDASDSTVIKWQAAAKLDAMGWSSRIIATSSCSVDSAADGTQTCVGKPFRYDATAVSGVSGSLTSNLATATADQQTMLDFLHGDRSNEGSKYRSRDKLLGDIVNSKVVVLNAPAAPYSDSANPGYSTFVANNAGRSTVVYVGANDGMLHAFSGGASGGKELFAYVPNALFAGPNSTPNIDGLAALSNTTYAHHYYVDSTPQIRDVNFSQTGADWHTLLVGGLGKGGKAYYALDVTNPSTYTNESTLANKVLWEFKHKHMGYSYGKPLMVKTKRDGWVVVLTSGYNNDDGNGYIFIVNPKNGKLISTSVITSSSSSTEVGLTAATAFVNDVRDFTADAIYVADLQGNVWRLDVTTASGSYAAPTQLAKLGKAITMPPVVEVDASTGKRYVIVGTGRYLATTDIDTAQSNTIYSLLDGTDAAFFTSATLPTNGKLPIDKSVLVDNTNSLLTGITADTTKPMGFYVDIGAYLVNVDIKSAAGFAVVAANLPSNDICNPQTSSRLYGFSFSSGKSILTGADGNLTSYISQSGLIVSTAIVISNGTVTVLAGYSDGTIASSQANLGSSQGYMQLNWREVPTSQ